MPISANPQASDLGFCDHETGNLGLTQQSPSTAHIAVLVEPVGHPYLRPSSANDCSRHRIHHLGGVRAARRRPAAEPPRIRRGQRSRTRGTANPPATSVDRPSVSVASGSVGAKSLSPIVTPSPGETVVGRPSGSVGARSLSSIVTAPGPRAGRPPGRDAPSDSAPLPATRTRRRRLGPPPPWPATRARLPS